jgi:hypothetical protein
MKTIFEDEEFYLEGPDAGGDLRIGLFDHSWWVNGKDFLDACNKARVSFGKDMEKYDEK